MTRAALLGLLSACLCTCTLAQAATQSLCIYDPSGIGGEAYRAGLDFKLEMAQQGVELAPKAYTNERVAVEDFRTGQCDAVMATALRTRQFNGIAAALDAVGAATVVRQGRVDMEASFEVVRRFVETMSSPKAAELMVSGVYEVAGILPLGAAYAFSNDREVSSLEAARGKRVATLEHDKAQAEVVRAIGATAVSADTMNFANLFNNGSVDLVIAPTMAYKPMELHRGLSTKGGVSRFPMTILTYQLIIRSSEFPKGFGQKAREYMAQNFDVAIASLRLADRGVPVQFWVDPPAAAVQRNAAVLRQVRIQMAEQGVYDKRGLRLAKKLRCQVAPDAAECVDALEN